MFKRLTNKSNFVFILLFFPFTFSFAGKRLSTLFKENGIIYLGKISRGSEKTVLKVKINGVTRNLACSYFCKSSCDPAKSLELNESSFLKEYGFFISNKHKNIIKYKGYLAFDGHFCIFTELADSNLRDCCFSHDPIVVFKQKVNILRDIISGIGYLHSKNLIHGDLKPRNVVIFYGEENNILAKLIDFTFSRRAGTYNRICGSIGYMPPEVLTKYNNGLYEITFSIKFDIFSFAVLTYYLFYEKHIDEDLKEFLVAGGLDQTSLRLSFFDTTYKRYTRYYIEQLNNGYRPKLDNELVDPDINKLIKICWDDDPENRPTASEILEILNNIK